MLKAPPLPLCLPLCLFLFWQTAACLAQPKGREVCWQPNQALTYADFRGRPTHHDVRHYLAQGYKSSLYKGLRYAVDLAGSKDARRKEVYALAPVYLPDSSFLLERDTVDMFINNLVFDLAEVMARRVRRETEALLNELYQASGVQGLFVPYLIGERSALLGKLHAGLIQRGVVEGDARYLARARLTADSTLAATAAYATSAEDCRRLQAGAPLLPGYEQNAWTIDWTQRRAAPAQTRSDEVRNFMDSLNRIDDAVLHEQAVGALRLRIYRLHAPGPPRALAQRLLIKAAANVAAPQLGAHELLLIYGEPGAYLCAGVTSLPLVAAGGRLSLRGPVRIMDPRTHRPRRFTEYGRLAAVCAVEQPGP